MAVLLTVGPLVRVRQSSSRPNRRLDLQIPVQPTPGSTLALPLTLRTGLRSQIFVAAAFVFLTMEFHVGEYERTVS